MKTSSLIRKGERESVIPFTKYVIVGIVLNICIKIACIGGIKMFCSSFVFSFFFSFFERQGRLFLILKDRTAVFHDHLVVLSDMTSLENSVVLLINYNSVVYNKKHVYKMTEKIAHQSIKKNSTLA